MDFVSRVLSLSQEHGPGLRRSCSYGRMEEDRKRVEAHESKEEAVCAHPRTKETNVAEGRRKGRQRWKKQKGYFRHGGMGRTRLFSSAASSHPPGPPLRSRSLRINVARHTAKSDTADPRAIAASFTTINFEIQLRFLAISGYKSHRLRITIIRLTLDYAN